MATVTRKNKRFIDAYLETWEGKRAAEIAGYKDPTRQAWRLLHTPEIQAEIERRMEEIAMRSNEVLARLAEQARASIARFIVFEPDPGTGELVYAGVDWGAVEKYGHLIKAIRNTRYGVQLELHDGQAALIQIGKAVGALTERLDLTTQGQAINVTFYIPSNGRETGSDKPTDSDA